MATKKAKAKPASGRTTNKQEEFKVAGEEVLAKLKELLREGNARRILIKDESGETILEIPVTIGVAGVLVAPVLAAVGGLAALLTHCTIVVIKK